VRVTTPAEEPRSVKEPSDGLPRYRLLTGPDDRAFCERVSDAIAQGWQLYGSPAAAATADGALLVAQALIWATPS
jgi:hypothetical protein